MTAGWGTVYAWLRSSAPIRRRVTQGQRSKQSPRISEDNVEGEGVVLVEQEWWLGMSCRMRVVETLHLVMVLIMGMRQLHKPHLHNLHLHNLHLEGLRFISSYLAPNHYLHLC